VNKQNKESGRRKKLRRETPEQIRRDLMKIDIQQKNH
jgi:hypothetical protein